MGAVEIEEILCRIERNEGTANTKEKNQSDCHVKQPNICFYLAQVHIGVNRIQKKITHSWSTKLDHSY